MAHRASKGKGPVPEKGYLPVDVMQRLVGISQDTGYMSLDEVQTALSGESEYMSVESLRTVFQKDGGYMTTQAMQAMIREAEDTGYMTTDGMQEMLSRMQVADAYFVPEPTSGEGIYMTTDGTQETVKAGANQMQDSYIALGQQNVGLDGGYQELPGDGTGSYQELPGDGSGSYQEPPVGGVVGGAGNYQELPQQGYDELPSNDGTYSEPQLDAAGEAHAISVNGVLTAKQKKQLEKERAAKAKAEEKARKQGAKDREKLLKQSLKRENTAKRRASKQLLKEQKEEEKRKKKEEALEKQKQKQKAKQELVEAKRRMTLSKQEFKSKKKSGAINLEEEKTRRETISMKLKEGAARAAALDREEARKKWMAYAQHQRYLAMKHHRTSKEGYLSFKKGELIAVLQKPDDTAWFGLNVNSGEKGVFLPDCVVLADT